MSNDKWHPLTICQYCNRELAIQNIKQHEKACKENPINKNKIYICEQCNKKYNLNENNTFRFCSKSCSRTYSSLKVDREKTKKANCLKCNKEFNIHIQRSIKIFICNECKNKYKLLQSKSKNIKIEKIKLKLESKIFNCEFCNRVISAQNIKRHELSCKQNPIQINKKYNYKRKDIRDGYIYKIINLINQKIYIGKCKGSPEKSKDYFGSGIAITRAIKKYDKKNFKKEILEIVINGDLNEREKYWIDHYNSYKGNGYNLTPGGDGGSLFQNHNHTKETKRLISEGVLKNLKRVRVVVSSPVS